MQIVRLSKELDEYRVSVKFRVFDEAGAIVLKEDDSPWAMTSTANGLTGNVELGVNSSKFAPPAAGKIRVESTWSFRNTAKRMRSAEVLVYDRVSDHTTPGVYAALFGVSGGGSLLLGAGLLFTGLVTRLGAKVPTIAG